MPAPKSQYTLSLRDWQFRFLTEMSRAHGLPDESKAVRCLINYARTQTDRQPEIFTQVRCLGTDGKPASCGCSDPAASAEG
jgi:hypothetical protein